MVTGPDPRVCSHGTLTDLSHPLISPLKSQEVAAWQYPVYRRGLGFRQLWGLAHGLCWYQAQPGPGSEVGSTTMWVLWCLPRLPHQDEAKMLTALS